MNINYNKLIRYAYYVTLFFAIVTLNGCSNETSKLDKIKTAEILRVAIITDPPHYFNRPLKKGYDLEIVYHYARAIGVKLKIIEVSDSKLMIPLLEKNKIDIGITGSAPDFFGRNIKNAITYNNSEWYIVANRSNKKLPISINKIKSNSIIVGSNSNARFILGKANENYESLISKEFKKNNIRKTLKKINTDSSKLTIINSDTYIYYRNLFPKIKIALTLPKKYPTRWIIKDNKELSLVYSINRFFNSFKKDNNLKKINESYFQHLNRFDYIDVSRFLERISKKLPKYKKYFKKAAEITGLDPRIIAAVSYQESHWDRKARSPTGVRGMMMLTLKTAKQMGVKNRLNAEQSIYGGAKYLKKLYESFDGSIEGSDRLYFTIAAYNIGLGHLKDAREITKTQGGNPNIWFDVKKYLPKLGQKKWNKKTRYGFARGYESIEFVTRVMQYYDILCIYKDEGLF